MKNKSNYLSIKSYLNKKYISDGFVYILYSDREIISFVSKFKTNLKNKTNHSGINLTTKLIDGILAENPQIQLYIEIPEDWTPSRFKEVALKEWEKIPWVDTVLTAYTFQK